jgi:hypothetical protein
MPVITWERFIARRNINISDWIRRNNVTNYKGFCTLLLKLDIHPPKVEEVESYFAISKPAIAVPEPIVQSVDTTLVKAPPPVNQPVKKKSTRRTRTKRSGGKGV